MNIRDLRYFVAVAETGHFGKAAERCFVSQPTLSGQVKKLEDELKATLFERTSRRVLLTKTGAMLLPRARRVLSEISEITELAAQSSNPEHGRFRLGAISTVSAYLFPQIVTGLKTILPDLRLVLEEGTTQPLIDKLIEGELDAVIASGPLQSDLLNTKTIMNDEFWLAVPETHILADSQSVKQDSLAGTKILLLEDGHCFRDQALDICRLNYIEQEQDFRATSIETLRLMVQSGTGVTLIPAMAIRQSDRGLKYIELEPPPVRSIEIFWRKTSTRDTVIESISRLIKTMATSRELS